MLDVASTWTILSTLLLPASTALLPTTAISRAISRCLPCTAGSRCHSSCRPRLAACVVAVLCIGAGRSGTQRCTLALAAHTRCRAGGALEGPPKGSANIIIIIFIIIFIITLIITLIITIITLAVAADCCVSHVRRDAVMSTTAACAVHGTARWQHTCVARLRRLQVEQSPLVAPDSAAQHRVGDLQPPAMQ